ncbi:hypothetical protein GGF32_000923 [Allomyces javanicus]|nr:hypothetical protein GGF32_000923 [Allomyces javanicus]
MTDLGAPVAAAVAAASIASSTAMPAPSNTSFPDPTVEDVPDSGENALQGQTDITIDPSAADDAMDLDDPPPSTTAAPPRRKRRPRRGDLLLFVVHGMGRQDWLPRNVESLRSSVTAILADSAAAAVVDTDADADADAEDDVVQDATSHDAHLPFRRATGPLRHVGRVDLVPIEYHSVLHATTKAAIDRIRLPSCPAMRTVIDEFVVDPLYYFTPFHGQFVRNEVVRQLNAKYAEYMAAHPTFRGHVALVAHSQGGIVMWDLLNAKVADGVAPVAVPLAFPLTHVFTMGSPIANVVVLRGHDQGLSRNAEAARDDLASSLALPSAEIADDAVGLRAHYAHPTTQFFSLFHPLDPIAYRLEPLFDAHLASVPPVPVPVYVPPAVAASADRSAAGALILRQWNDRWRRAILASLAGALPTLAPILRAPQAFSNPLPHLSRHMRSIVDALVAAGAAGAEAAAAVVAAAMRAEQQQAQQGQDEVARHDGYSSDDEQGQDEDDEDDEGNEVDAVANGDAPLLARRRRARRRPVSPPVVTGITDRQDSGAAVDGDATDAMDVDPIVTSPLSPSSWRLPFLSSSRTSAVAPADLSKDDGAVSAGSDEDGENDNDETPLHPPSPVLTQPGLTTPVNATPRRKRRRVESIPASTTTTTTTLTTITGPCLVVTPAGMVPPTATVAASASAAAAATVRAGHAVATAAVSVAASSATAVAAWAPRNPRAAASLWAMLRGDATAATAPAQEGADVTPSSALDLDADVDRVVPPIAPADVPTPQTADSEEATIKVEDEDGARESTQLLPGRARRIPPVAREPSALSLDEDAPAVRPPASRRTIPPRRIVPASSTVTSRRIRTEGDYVVNQLRSMFTARGTSTPAPPPPPLTRTPSVSAATTTAPTTATVPVPLDVAVDAIPSPPVSDPEEGEAKPEEVEDAAVAAAQDAETAKAAIARLPRGQRLDYVLQVPPARGILPSNEYLGGLRAHFNYWGSKDVMWFVLRTLDGVLAEALGFEDASEDEEEVVVGEPVHGVDEKGDVSVADAVVEEMGGPALLAPSEGLEPFVEGMVLE